jgi:tetratricopeptide (TPR) repeat protein
MVNKTKGIAPRLSRKPGDASPPLVAATPAAEAIAAARALAWTGRHAHAIESCGHGIAARPITPAQYMELLDLRAESLIAEGRFADAARDVTEMLSLARGHKQSALEVQALNRQALVLMRQGEIKSALDVAAAAVILAQKVRKNPLLAQSLLRQAKRRSVRPKRRGPGERTTCGALVRSRRRQRRSGTRPSREGFRAFVPRAGGALTRDGASGSRTGAADWG